MKLAIISGGSRGLGQSLCELYRARGWEVIEFSRSAPHPWSVKADLADPGAAHRVFSDTLAPLATRGWTDILVIANAGVLAPIGPTARKDPALVLANIQTNYASPVMLMSAAIAAFQDLDCRKTLLNISSGAAMGGMAGWSLYCGAKAGLENFVRSVAVEQTTEAHPIKVLNINPGVIDTGMQADIRAASSADFPAVERFIQRKADGELRPPARVAGAIARIVDEAPDAGGSRIGIEAYLGDAASA
jgi:benzil reductase ((S)-benzoin forming)